MSTDEKRGRLLCFGTAWEAWFQIVHASERINHGICGTVEGSGLPILIQDEDLVRVRVGGNTVSWGDKRESFE